MNFTKCKTGLRPARAVLGVAALAVFAVAQSNYASLWWSPGQDGVLPAMASYDDPTGKLGLLNTSGAIDTKGHPFFEPLGTNGRACVTCHQPANGMSLSIASLVERWNATQGKDPVFAAVDGSNCPNLPQAERASHSLLLERGLIRVDLPWPPAGVQPEFKIEVIRDPTGCNTSREYGLTSATPKVSVYRRPRVAANLKYVQASIGLINIKTGLPLVRDPETGRSSSMNFMSDAREPSLKTQAVSAALDHEEAKAHPTEEQLRKIVEFETQVYVAQAMDQRAGNLAEPGGPDSLGPESLARARAGALGDNLGNPVFGFFEAWKKPTAGDARSEFRASVVRGSEVFFTRPFWISDATHINSIGLGNPIKRTCATCHNARMTGMDLAPGWVDVGTTNLPTANESPELPLFRITCDKDARPHPFLGRVIYTQDPGRALISGRCMDVGSIVTQQFRGLAARAPYFSNGSAKSLRELVDFYDRRFNIRYTDQEKQDLINFLGVL